MIKVAAEKDELGQMELAALLLLVFLCHQTAASIKIQNAEVVTITRLNNGDVFSANGGECNSDTCVGLTSGTAAFTSLEDATVSKESCSCQCHQHLPTFREDLRICVDDIHECVLAPFVSGSTSQKIPFVFLPLKGQIIHPSKEINFTGIKTPVCAVSGSNFLTEHGWKDLRNFVDSDVPFQLFIDEGRTFLQWTGETELRQRMTGRLIVVHLLCRDSSKNQEKSDEVESIFTPCVAFRVVGTPLKYLQNVSEVVFSAGAQASEDTSNSRLSVTEYIAIGICSILLGLIYVASVFLYLHIRKRKKGSRQDQKSRDNQSLAAVEEGVIKNNPLLGLSRHFTGVDNNYSDSGSSDAEITPDLVQNHFDRKKNTQTTSALVHPQTSFYHCSPYVSKAVLESMNQDSSNIERLPEENVSIIETIEGREERPDAIRAISGSTRKKLYFNPAYFEPELLLAPPPAALEFLTKIREVIAIAKQKMACKKFSPSLLGIPEEEGTYFLDSSFDQSRGVSSRRSSMISLKRENSRRRTCTGCPACEPQDLKDLCGKLPEFPSLVACQTCTSTKTDSKQRSIQKWLENVPMLKSSTNEDDVTRYPSVKSLQDFGKSIISPKRIRSPTRSLSPSYTSPPLRTLSPKPASERACSPSSESYPSISSFHVNKTQESFSRKKVTTKPKAPPPPIRHNEQKETKHNFSPSDNKRSTIISNCESVKTEIPTLTRNMKAVINEFSSQHGLQSGKIDSDCSTSPDTSLKNTIEYEADSLERSHVNKGNRTPTDYADLSSQPSPSLSSALPMAEEMTMRNAILNTKTGSMTVSRLNAKNSDVHLNDDYELIVVRKGLRSEIDKNLFRLPEYFHKGNGYNLVSEVYVNNGYSFGSTSSSPAGSNCSTLEKKKKPKIKYAQPETKPGQLTIEVEDCPDNYIRVEDSDNFEPDTLDRKPSRRSVSSISLNNNIYDSFRRSNSILLRTTGSFKNNSFIAPSKINNTTCSNFQRTFRSLREIYELKKNKHGLRKSVDNLTMLDAVYCGNEDNFIAWKNELNNKDYEGKLLTLQERHLKRQRRLASQNVKAIPPDVIPPPPLDNSVYEHPKPPRKIIIDVQGAPKPPLPPKNGNGRSTSQTQNIKQNLPASPCSDHYCDMPSVSLSGTSVSPNSSDYETYNTLGEAKQYVKNENLQSRCISSDPTEYKNAINNGFTVQTPKTYYSFTKIKSNADNNNNNRSMYSNNNDKDFARKQWYKSVPNIRSKIMDSGYLSTDSNDSLKKPNDSEKDASVGSETDESLGDGHSESGAESVETHSVFFGSYRKPFYMSHYSDGIPELDVNILPEEYINADAPQMKYATVVPVDNTS
ncbi:hypothetical protein RN001_000724 [Aquatica leii]|uniref:Shavenoid isoform B-like N-terminal domain-containing protein n=1 Tax=Aquatica leii TaxID=1421715 RepID=A0AAN7PFP9_9COLE|nr:hypothetical protein RN001_000724 [Aquatica leii]